MDPWFIFFLLVAIGAIAVVALAIFVLRRIIMQHFAGTGGGWNGLARIYATQKAVPDPAWKRQTVVVGSVLYRNCVSVASDSEGLYLVLSPSALLRRPPLFIPWTEFKRLESGRLYWQEAALLSLGEPVRGTLTMPLDLFVKIHRFMTALAAAPHTVASTGITAA